MRNTNSGFDPVKTRLIALVLAIPFSIISTTVVSAQVCPSPSATPSNSTTAEQDRDRMMCIQGLTWPILPVRSGTAWPWNDPTAPTNARPTSLASPEGNWTDPQGHVVVRTRWGLWHTYDADPIYSPNASQHYNPGSTVWPFPTLNGGALSGAGDYGPESNPRYTDIDLLKLKNGTSILSPEDWWIKRRPEIFNLIQQQFYGTPIPNSFAISWTVGAVTTGTTVVAGVSYPWRQKTFTGTVDKSSYPALRNTPVITAQCRFPAATGVEYPVVVTYGEGTGIFQFTAPYGYGTCSYTPTGVQPDSGGSGALSSYIIGLNNQGNWREPDDPGSLVAWGWGISRLIDRFATDPDIDEDKIAVEGHSRYGKATLVTAAYDDRVVVAWPSDAGAMGTAMMRRHYGETLEFVSSSSSEYHWVNGQIMNYGGRLSPDNQFPRRLELLDVDAHSTTALIAPRAIFVTNGTDTPAGVGDAWADPRGCFLSGKLASPVWNLLGWKGQIVPAGTPFTWPGTPGNGVFAGPAESIGGTPAFDLALIEGTVGWRRQKEGHTPTPNWPTFALFASRYLKDKRPVITTGQSFNLPNWPSSSLGTALGTDGDAGDTIQSWQITGGTGAYIFKIDPTTGAITIPDRSKLDGNAHTYTLALLMGDGKLPAHVENVSIDVPADTAAPVPDAATLPTVTGECSAEITGPAPTATDAYVGPVTGTTTDPLSYSTQGEHIVTWKFDDGHGNVSTQTQTVLVKDTIAPSIDGLSATPNVIGLRNHSMVAVVLTAAVTDACDSSPTTSIESVTSNEPVNGDGDGDTSPDWEITGTLTLNLRAERAGGGSGRIYTITVKSVDDSGNISRRTVTVMVPHNN